MSEQERAEQIRKLLDEIEYLEQEEKEYEERKDEELREEVRRKLYIDGTGKKEHSLYPNVSKEWNNTYFTSKRELVEQLANASLSKENMKIIQVRLKEYEYRFKGVMPVKIVAYCSSIVSTEKGPALVLSDPYRSIVSETLHISEDDAYEFVGKTLLLDIGIKENNEDYIIKRVKVLKPLEHIFKEN